MANRCGRDHGQERGKDEQSYNNRCRGKVEREKERAWARYVDGGWGNSGQYRTGRGRRSHGMRTRLLYVIKRMSVGDRQVRDGEGHDEVHKDGDREETREPQKCGGIKIRNVRSGFTGTKK